MKKIDIKSINVKRNDCHSGSLLQFEHEGVAVYYSAADAGFIDSDEATARTTTSGVSEFERGIKCDVYVRYSDHDEWNEPLFREAANSYLESIGVKLGRLHDAGQWYELEAI